MEKNNGKIAIAIVAMFVVALSIVGVTYAYFVSNVQTNTTDEIDVQAGILQVNYTAGNSLDTTGITIVPGWKNDGKMVYHPTASINTEGHITSVDVNTVPEDDKTTYNAKVRNPIAFTITNSSEPAGKEAFYGIRLTGVDVTVAKSNVKVYLTGADGTLANGVALSALKADAAGNLYASLPLSITTETDNYSLVVEYVETTQEQDEKGKKIEFTVEVVGLQYVNGSYMTSSGATWATSLTA